MCLKTPRLGMGSEPAPAASTTKVKAKPLSPDAEPFLVAKNSFLRLPNEVYGDQMERTNPYPQLAADMVPLPLPLPLSLSTPYQTELGFLCVYSDGSLMLIPNSLEAVKGYTPSHSGCWYPCNSGFYNHVPASHDARCNRVNHMNDINTRVSNRRSMGRTLKSRVPTASPAISLQWRVKARNENQVHQSSTSGGGASDGKPIIPFPSTLEEAERSETTTVMIKNIPYNHRFNDLLRILDDHCWKQNHQCGDPSLWAKYDFIYLPMDYIIHARDSKLSNLGYAFVNFTTARAAFRFFEQFHGYKWDENKNRKPCEVTCAKLQGKEVLKSRFEQKVFRCRCPSFRPVEFSPARDGFNERIRGKPVGQYVEGLPGRNNI